MTLNKKGFILLQALLSLFIVCIVSLLLCQMMTVMTHTQKALVISRLDQRLAAIQLENELLSGSMVQASGSTLTFTLDGQTIRYAKSGDRFIRTVNSNGFEIILLSLQSVAFERQNKLIKMTLTDLKGGTSIWYFINGID